MLCYKMLELLMCQTAPILGKWSCPAGRPCPPGCSSAVNWVTGLEKKEGPGFIACITKEVTSSPQ